MPARVLPLLDDARFHVPDRRSGHGLEPRPAALSRNRQALSAPHAARRTSSPSTSTSSIAIRTSIPPSSRPAPNCSSSCTWRPPRSRASRSISRTPSSPPDLPLLPAAGAVVPRAERDGAKLTIDSPRGVGVAWPGDATRRRPPLARHRRRNSLASPRPPHHRARRRNPSAPHPRLQRRPPIRRSQQLRHRSLLRKLLPRLRVTRSQTR